jgi:hypothetical protein
LVIPDVDVESFGKKSFDEIVLAMEHGYVEKCGAVVCAVV